MLTLPALAACCPAALQAIDHTTQVLSLKYNRGQPVIFNTYQTYLKDSHMRLLEDMERARREGYLFAAKLVRCVCVCVCGFWHKCSHCATV